MTKNNLIKTLEIEDQEEPISKEEVHTNLLWKQKAEQIKKDTNNFNLDDMCKQCLKQQLARGIKDENGNPKYTISCVGLETTKNLRGEEFYNYLKSTQTEEDMEIIEQSDNALKWMEGNIEDKRVYSPRPYQKMIAACSAKRKVLRMGRRCLEANEYIEGINKKYKAKHLWHLYKHHKKMPEIIAYDDVAHKLVKTKEYVIIPNGLKRVFKVTTVSGKSTTVTKEHPLLVFSENQYMFKPVFELKENLDSVLTIDNTLEPIISIKDIGVKQTYHLSVVKYQTFATKGGLIHHNTGKALDVRTEIPTPNGWKTMGELKEGDKVFDDYGNECNVTYVTEYQYDRACYQIRFDNGETIIADADHQWSVTSEEDRKDNLNKNIVDIEQVLTTEQILNSDSLYSIRVTKPVVYSHKSFSITPFIYGTELSNTFNKDYLQGSIEQRTALLRGIEQTNTYQPGCVRVSYSVKDEVKELLCSLGYKVYTIQANNNLVYFQYSKDKLLHMVDIKKVETRPVKCITVDSENSLYLASRNYIVTHNTFVMTVGILHRLLTKEGSKGAFRVLMVAPMETMIAEVADQIKKFCDALPVNPIVSSKKSPNYEIIFNTGASFKGVTAGSSGAKGVRGKGADLLYVDECFPKGTLIKTQERGLIPIEEIKTGEKILSFDTKKNSPVYRKVTATSSSGIQKVYTYTTLSGRKIRCTPNHPVLTRDGWKEIEQAKDIATVKTRAKCGVFYESIINNKHTSTEEVFNLAVEGTQNYIADGFVVHNCDFLRPQDLTSILGILMESKDVEFWASSTPIGETNLYKLHKDPAFKEFHFPSFVSPEYTQETEDTVRGQMTDAGYTQEVCAEFGADDEGVYPLNFLNKYVEEYTEDLTEHSYRSLKGIVSQQRDRFILIMGVDWNHDKVGTRIFIVAFDKQTNLYHILDKDNVASAGWTQTKAIQKIVELNRKHGSDHIYVDEGFGVTQASLLRMHGVSQYGKVPPNHPDLKLAKVVAVNFRSTLIIHDPISGDDLRKQTKQYIVETSANLLRNGLLRLHENYDSDIINQMKNYMKKSRSASGLQTYTCRDKKIGDHDLDAYNIALFGFTQEYPDLITVSPISSLNLNNNQVTDKASVLTASSSIIINTRQSLISNKFRAGRNSRTFKMRKSW